MRNLEQIRAAHALKEAEKAPFSGEEGGEVVKKIPAYIRTNGFLATLAFSLEKGGGYERVFNSLAGHLSSKDVGLVKAKNGIELRKELVQCDSVILRLVTQESMAYLGYLRRFAEKS